MHHLVSVPGFRNVKANSTKNKTWISLYEIIHLNINDRYCYIQVEETNFIGIYFLVFLIIASFGKDKIKSTKNTLPNK